MTLTDFAIRDRINIFKYLQLKIKMKSLRKIMSSLYSKV